MFRLSSRDLPGGSQWQQNVAIRELNQPHFAVRYSYSSWWEITYLLLLTIAEDNYTTSLRRAQWWSAIERFDLNSEVAGSILTYRFLRAWFLMEARRMINFERRENTLRKKCDSLWKIKYSLTRKNSTWTYQGLEIQVNQSNDHVNTGT